MLRKSLFSLVLATVLGLALTRAAHAAGCTTVTISSGAKVCTSAVFANAKMCVSCATDAKAGCQVYWGNSPDNIPTMIGGSNEVAGSGMPVSSFTAAFDSFADPTLFPGWFVVCAVNRTSGSITVTLCHHPDTSPCPPAGS